MFGANGFGTSSGCDLRWWKTEAAQRQAATEAGLELVLATGERLRISTGVDLTMLRAVPEVLRA